MAETLQFPQLRQLGLERLEISDTALNSIIAGCPALEYLLIDRLLHLDPYNPLRVSVISAPKLETLGCLCDHCYESKLVFGTAVIQKLRADCFTTVASSVKILAISITNLSLDMVIDLMRCFPCLEKLYIQSYVAKGKNLWRRKHRNLTRCLDIRLKTIVLKNYQGTMSQVNFAMFFVSNARMLEFMRFEKTGWITTLGEIISLLPTKDGVRTQTLASRWRHLWLSSPLNLDHKSMPTDEEAKAGIISRILAAHPGPVRRFSVPQFDLDPCGATVDAWLRSPALDHLQEFEFDKGAARAHFPSLPASAFRFTTTLRVFTMRECHLLDETVQTFQFPQLRQLSLYNVRISEVALHGIISRCPVLEYFLLDGSFGFRCLRINSPSLKSIAISSGELIIEDAPLLQRLLQLQPRSGLNVSVISAPKVETLGCLGYDSDLTFWKQPRNLLSGKHEDLDLIRCNNLWRRKHCDLIRCLDIRLKKVVLKNYRGIKSQVNFASFFVLNAKMLELMRFEVSEYNDNEVFIAEQHRLLQLEKRASRGAQFYFTTGRRCHSYLSGCNLNHIKHVLEPTEIRDVLRCILHTIFFHRTLSLVRPKDVDCDFLEITYVQCGLPELEKEVDEKIDQFIAWLEKHPNRRSQVCLSFFDEKNKNPGWFVNKTERIYWEQWFINLHVMSPKRYSKSNSSRRLTNVEGNALEETSSRRAALESSINEVLFQIINFANEKKDHIPAIPDRIFNHEIMIPRPILRWPKQIFVEILYIYLDLQVTLFLGPVDSSSDSVFGWNTDVIRRVLNSGHPYSL
ncbi:hypothetical protein C2845_PM09G07050 [Panicum miliaceum]|uniref:Uncharacterized protein n=1 Tax=Panicum miliaceum TaxID=4540 RepID=A0A3L6S1U3_PANMI|nr:hypothetical protein C2845_PM09G07050 [Panicum miliaceum]